MELRPKILLSTEGTYPHYHGGVSVWCDQLIRSLYDFDFHLMPVIHSPGQKLSFALPPNVVSMNPEALWSTEEPAWRNEPVSKLFEKRLRTTSGDARFLPAFRTAVRHLLAGAESSPEELAAALVWLRGHFRDADYVSAIASRAAWDTFLDECRLSGRPMRLEEATQSLRWIARFLSVITAPIPRGDLFHASMAGLAAVPGVLAKLETGMPFLLTEHGVYLREIYLSLSRSESSEGCRRFLNDFYQAIVRMNYHFADAVTTLGRFNTIWQVRFGAPPDRVIFTPNGVDPRKFHPGEVLPQRPTILTLARIYPLKGIDILLKAAVRVRTRVPDVRVRVLGEVADQEYFERCRRIVSEHHMEDVVEFSETDNPAEAYRAAHVYCLPSISEAMPYVVIEAMLSGCPVVATDVGNVSEMLAGTGLLARPADPDDLAEQLIQMLDGVQGERLRNRMKADARERALSIYTIDSATGRFRDLYCDMAGVHTTFGEERQWNPESLTV